LNSLDISEFEIEVLFCDCKISVFSIHITWFAQFEENEECQSLVDPTIDPIRGVICRKLYGKLDGLSDRNEQENFRSDLVRPIQRGRERNGRSNFASPSTNSVPLGRQKLHWKRSPPRAFYFSLKTILIKESEDYTCKLFKRVIYFSFTSRCILQLGESSATKSKSFFLENKCKRYEYNWY